MAEESDNSKKPKAELIKRSTTERTTTEAEQGERRKVIVVKKKTTTAAPLPAAAPVVKKAQPKVVVRGGSVQESAGEEEAKLKSQEAVSPPAAAASAPAIEESAKINQDTPQDTPIEEPKEKAVESETVKEAVPFTLTQRPVAAAGRVGGKYVGPRPSHEDSVRSPSFNQRSSNAQRPEFRNDNRNDPRNTGRPAGPGQGNRPQGNLGENRGAQRPFVPGRNQNMPNRSGSGAPRPGGAPGTQQRPFGNQGRSGARPSSFGNNNAGTAPPIMEGKGQAKKSFKAKKPVYTRKDKEQEMGDKLLQTKKKITQVANPIPKSIEIMEVVTVSDLAKKMNLKASDLIQKLMSMGQMVTINQQIDADTATIIAAEFGSDVKIVSLYDETIIETSNDDEANMTSRPPVVTIMGHVDHGKTKLLDAIRSADVVSGEFGGITQHIGAYTVDTPMGRITFLDTPGHEAFTRMRARGAQVTDIVVLVVAADDGVMPQTIEAINHAKEADVPIIVAVNKIDKPEANPDRIKTQLSDHNLIPEDWGGNTMFVELSALKKEGIDKLIESILLEAELLDLKANFERNAEGKVLESRIDHGRGVVATVMVEKGTLRVGDSFVAGVWSGKVRALFNDKGEKVDEATPSVPIEILGFEGIPNAGDPIQVVEDEKTARSISTKRQEFKRFEDAKNIRKITLDNLHATISEGAIQELKVIIKADVQGSAEALRSSLERLSTGEIRLHVIQALPGAVNEGDVDLAVASNAIIICFNVRPIPKAKALAEQERIDIRRYNVIYKAVEEIQLAMEGMLKPESKEEVIATVEVREIYRTPRAGTIAGCYVNTGTVKRSGIIHVIRDSIEVHTGKISSLRRFKDDVREVSAGFECGIGLENFNDINVGDQFEVFEIVEIARKLGAVS